MENAKANIKKGKTIKKILCYFGLVILNILLFAPMVLRIVYKDRGPKKDEDVITILNCEKTDESISSTFLNDNPVNMRYRVVGNYEMTSEEDTEIIIDKPILKKFIVFSKPVYDEAGGYSEIKFNTTVAQGSLDYEIYFNTVGNQEEYFKTQGFSCNKTIQ